MENQKQRFKEEFGKRLVKYTVDILKLADQLREQRNLWSVADQISRSAASIGANVAEAKGAASMKDYKHFFEIALKSANETDYWLAVLEEYGKQNHETVLRLRNELLEIRKIITSAVLTMKGKKVIQHS